jgi:hypothetical protein
MLVHVCACYFHSYLTFLSLTKFVIDEVIYKLQIIAVLCSYSSQQKNLKQEVQEWMHGMFPYFHESGQSGHYVFHVIKSNY